MSNTAQIPDPIAALAEVTGRLVPFDTVFASKSEQGKVATQRVLQDLARNARLTDEDEGSQARSLHIVTNRGEATGLNREQIVALRTPTGKILVVQQQATTTQVIRSGSDKGKSVPRYEVVALAEVPDETECIAMMRNVLDAQKAADAVVDEGFFGLDAGTDIPEADQAAEL